MRLSDLFDFSKFKHQSLFEKATNLWDPMVLLEDYIKNYLENQKRKGAALAGKNTQIDPSAKISNSSLIGNNCKILEGAHLRDGVIIGNNCVIGHDSEVKHSVILDNSNVTHFNYVGDSIIGNNVNMAAGAVTANFKHSEKNPLVNLFIKGKKTPTSLLKFGALIGDGVKIGCNSVLSPGTIVGKNTIIYPLVLIHGSINANKIVKCKQNLEFIKRE